jgi:predicted dienelactone hydrolase
MSRRIHPLIVLNVVVWIALSAGAQAQRPDAPSYALPGPHSVGTRELTLDGARPLSITAWYPALNPDAAPVEITYQLGLLGLPGAALAEAAPDLGAGPYPLVVFSHGWGLSRLLYTDLLEHVAGHGFVVLAVEHSGNSILDALLGTEGLIAETPAQFALRPGDLLRVVEAAEGFNAPDGPLAGIIDTERTAVMGHSFGGYTALSAAGARLDFAALRAWCDANAGGPLNAYPDVAVHPPDSRDFDGTAGVCFLREAEAEIARLRGLDAPPDGLWPLVGEAVAGQIDAVVALSPWAGPLFGPEGADALNIPALVVVGSADQVTIPERDALPIYAGLGSDEKALFTLENANHFVYLDECAPALRQFGQFFVCSDEVWDMARAHDLIFHAVTAFLRAELYSDDEAEAALTPQSMAFVGTRFETRQSQGD